MAQAMTLPPSSGPVLQPQGQVYGGMHPMMGSSRSQLPPAQSLPQSYPKSMPPSNGQIARPFQQFNQQPQRTSLGQTTGVPLSPATPQALSPVSPLNTMKDIRH